MRLGAQEATFRLAERLQILVMRMGQTLITFMIRNVIYWNCGMKKEMQRRTFLILGVIYAGYNLIQGPPHEHV